MKFHKRLIAMLLVLTMTVMAAAGCGGNSAGTKGTKEAGENMAASARNSSAKEDAGDSEDIFNVDMILMTYGATPSDVDAVESEINKITEKEIGVHVNLIPMGVGDMTTQLNLILSGSEKLDLVPVIATNFTNYVSKGQLLPMDDALEKYGQDIISNVGEAYLKAGQVDGKQYGVTTCRDNAKDYGFMMRKDLAEKYGVDFDKLDGIKDFEPYLKAVKEGEDGIIPLVTLIEKTPWYNMYGGIDPLGDYPVSYTHLTLPTNSRV